MLLNGMVLCGTVVRRCSTVQYDSYVQLIPIYIPVECTSVCIFLCFMLVFCLCFWRSGVLVQCAANGVYLCGSVSRSK